MVETLPIFTFPLKIDSYEMGDNFLTGHGYPHWHCIHSPPLPAPPVKKNVINMSSADVVHSALNNLQV